MNRVENAAPGRTLSQRLRRVNRITLGTAVAIIATIITASSFVIGLFAAIDTGRLQAKMLGESAAAALMFQDPKAASELLQPLRNMPQILAATLHTAPNRNPRPVTRPINKPSPLVQSSSDQSHHRLLWLAGQDARDARPA